MSYSLDYVTGMRATLVAAYDSYGGPDMYTTTTLPNGLQFLTRVVYTAKERPGVIALVATSTVSAIAIVGLLLAISLSAFNTRSLTNQHLFVRTHVAAYFICLLCSDMLQAVGSIMNARWVLEMSVNMGSYCQIQGAIKQAADVGTAMWSLIIAVHTFNVLFLQLEMHRYVLYAALVGGWTTIAAMVLGGPAILNTTERGPFFGISGYWCWISAGYPTERITLDYLIMFISAFGCFILYSLVFLRLRGNIVLHGWRARFRFNVRKNTVTWRGQQNETKDNYTKVVARRMLLYPVAYTILLLPISVCRFMSFAGHDVSFEVTMFADVVFLMSGVVNVTLFSTTRRILPPKSVFKFLISRPKLESESLTPSFLNDAPSVTEKGTGFARNDYYVSYESGRSNTSSVYSNTPMMPAINAPAGALLADEKSPISVAGSATTPNVHSFAGRSPLATNSPVSSHSNFSAYHVGSPYMDGSLGSSLSSAGSQDVLYSTPSQTMLQQLNTDTLLHAPDATLWPPPATLPVSRGRRPVASGHSETLGIPNLTRSDTAYSGASLYDLYGNNEDTHRIDEQTVRR